MIKTLHTLGPAGSNCEKAAGKWFEQNNSAGEVVLYSTLEDALHEMPKNKSHALMGCVVYPKLHEIVFSNLDTFTLLDCIIVPTYSMVLAAQAEQREIRTVASHPAPEKLVPKGVECIYVNSNPLAAKMCAAGEVDACVTTLRSANDYELLVVKDFGEVMMGFTVHACSAT